MKIYSVFPMISIQLFADGAESSAAEGADKGQGVTAGAASQRKGAKNPLADVKYGIQEEAPAAEVRKTEEAPPERDLNAEFDKLIKGEYKAQYDARMQDTVQKRLKASKETVDKYNNLQPVLDILGQRYGVDASDTDALAKAIEADDSYLEDEANERGMSVKDLRELKKFQREAGALRRQVQEQQARESADRLYFGWMQQAEQTKTVYPGFDLRTEMENPKFVDLLRSNIDVRTAYEVMHKDEIIPAAMQFTAKTVEENLARKIASAGNRPTEDSVRARSASIVKTDVSQLTKADRDEIRRRVARGETIRF